jgi:hypothetical protein
LFLEVGRRNSPDADARNSHVQKVQFDAMERRDPGTQVRPDRATYTADHACAEIFARAALAGCFEI